MPTRLTILVSEELSRREKARAALEGRTLSSVVRESLEEFADGLDLIEEAEDIRTVLDIEARIARGEEEIHSWEEVKAELKVIDS